LLPVGDISLDNYSGVFDRVPAARFLANSVFVTAMIVGIGLVVNRMAGCHEWSGAAARSSSRSSSPR
jgi:ABC-type glycerol-3-phosphate transport system permease component